MAENHVSTTNACKMCTPMGASLAFRGVKGSMPFIHGSQGCATYMRRYIISHFREPADIASSSLGEKHAVFGGAPNLKKGILNVTEKYNPEMIGIASTCLTETIGDDLKMITTEFLSEFADLDLPHLVTVSTPSYSGTHLNGWKLAVRSMIEKFAGSSPALTADNTINIFPNFLSPADIRLLSGIFREYGLKTMILPNISDTLDSPSWEEYINIPEGGTSVNEIALSHRSKASIELGYFHKGESAGSYLEENFSVKNYNLLPPVGMRATDVLLSAIEEITGLERPQRFVNERGRLIDALVDGHKYINFKKALVYGDEDFVVSMVSFLCETGVKPVIAASGGKADLRKRIEAICEGFCPCPLVLEDSDFDTIEIAAADIKPDLMIGNSKGFKISKKLGIPLIRAGFPIHDRFGGQRIITTGYEGALSLLDLIVNTAITTLQEETRVGYGYM
ncbi:MAG: nitrogenase component 1 [Desulfobacteraceae bacterium]